jgi:hypothetical protein
MALTKCKECGAEISKSAKTCPACGHPAGVNRIGRGCAALLVVFIGLIVLAAISNEYSSDKATLAAPSCAETWSLCTDNADMINHYGHMFDATYSCKKQLESSVKYGDPEWTWFAFGSFRTGTDFPKTGIVKIVDPDVKVQNAFGAKVHARVECWYDFNAKTATIMDISER